MQKFRVLSSLLLVVLLMPTWGAKAQEPLLIEVDPSSKRQKMFGFGSGMVFYSDHLIKLSETDRNETCDWLWSDVEMDLLMFQTRNDIEKTNDNDDPFRLDRSKLDYKIVDRYAKLLKEAKQRRGDKMVFIATLYSPPTWLKDNGKTKGGGFDASKEANFLELAEFIYAWLDRLKTEHDIDTRYLTLANEPDWNHDQPGAKWSPRTLAHATDVTVDHLRKLVRKTRGMVMPKIIAANTLSVRSASRYMGAIAQNKDAKKNTDVVGFHLYDTGTKASDYEKLKKFDVPMWMTEWTGPRDLPKKIKSPITHSLGQMVGRFKAMHGGASVIMHFELGHPEYYSAGIFKANWKKPWKRDTPYYVWQQMVNQTPHGDKAWMVDSSVPKGSKDWRDRVTAYTNTKKRRTTVHIVNNTDSPVKKVNVTLSRKRLKSVIAFRTSEKENHIQLPKDAVKIDADGVSLDLPQYSFVTLQIKH